ncbi:MAG: hypothetical protein NC223_08835 [Butyrivibrio sp.]|nr:hypothetical protein [Butyrivibrio sp.]
MSEITDPMASTDCVYCRKVRSGRKRMAEGWLCNECYGKAFWGIRRFSKQNEKSSHCNEYNKRLTVAELDECFECLRKGKELRAQSTPTLSSSDGALLIDENKGLIYIGENVYSPLDEKYVSPAHRLDNIEGYFIMYYSEVISLTDNAVKSAYLMLEFKNEPLKYERIPLGKPKGFFNVNRRHYYRKRAKEYFDIMQRVTGSPPGKGLTVIYKP